MNMTIALRKTVKNVGEGKKNQNHCVLIQTKHKQC